MSPPASTYELSSNMAGILLLLAKSRMRARCCRVNASAVTRSASGRDSEGRQMPHPTRRNCVARRCAAGRAIDRQRFLFHARVPPCRDSMNSTRSQTGKFPAPACEGYRGVSRLVRRHRRVAGCVSAGPGKARDQTDTDRIAVGTKNDRDRAGASLAANPAGVPTVTMTSTCCRTKSAASRPGVRHSLPQICAR